MIAVIDARNRTIRVGLAEFEGEEVRWRSRFCLGADSSRSAEEYALSLRGLSLQFGVAPSSATRVILSSVVPSLTPRLRLACSMAFGPRSETEPYALAGGDAFSSMSQSDPGRPGTGDHVLVVGPGVRTGIKIRTDTPSEVGSDLVCDAIAAYERVGGGCIVVDFETMLTFTAINDQGELLGVAIAPGLQSAADTLRATGAQLPQVRLDAPKRAIGKNTSQSIQSGILLGYAGLVDRMVSLFRKEMKADAAVVGTGDEIGLALAPVGGFAFFDPWLSLEGLAALERRNQ